MPGALGGSSGSSSPVQYIPYNAGGTGQGGTVYTPSAQPQADTTYQALLNNLYGQYTSGTTPPQVNWPLAEQAALNIAMNPYAAQAQSAADAISPYAAQAGLEGLGWSNILQGEIPATANLGTELAGMVPQVQGLGAQAAGYAPNVAALGNQVAGYAPNVAALGNQVAGYMNPVTNYAELIGRGIQPLQGAAANILQTGYDPQGALRMSEENRVAEQAAGQAAQLGLGSSPYAAGLASDAIGNFDINWQNQQLAREAQALGAAAGGYGQAGTLGSEVGNLLGQAGRLGTEAGGLYGQAGGLLGQAGGLYGQAGGLLGQAGGLYGQAANIGTQAGGLYSRAPQIAGELLNLGSAGTNQFMQGAGLPYQTSVGQSQAALPALTSATNLGLSQYQIPQQVLNDLQSYLRLGQSASDISGVLGNMGFNQGQQQLGNLGALAGLGNNFLFGNQGLSGVLGLGSGGLLGEGGLFGGGASVGTDTAGLGADFFGGATGPGGVVSDLFNSIFGIGAAVA